MLLDKDQLQSIWYGSFIIFDGLNALDQHLYLFVHKVFAMELIKEKAEHDEQNVEIFLDEIFRKYF